MPHSSLKARRWLGPAIKLAIVALLVWGVHRTLGEAFENFRKQPWHLSPGWLILSGVLYLAGMVPAALFWHRLLRVLGQNASWPQAVRAYFIGHLGKYVPGKALVVVLRAGMVRGTEVSAAVAAVTVFIETLTMMACGSAIAAALIAVQFRGQWLYAVAAVGFMLAAGLPTLPPVFKRIIRLTKIGRLNPNAIEQLDRIDYGTLLLGWLATGIGWFVMGLSLIAAWRGIGREEPGWIDGLPLATTVVAVSIVAGFMSFIPGGLGVRDLVMAQLIKTQSNLGADAAVASAIVLRVVWLLAELAISAVLYFWRPRRAAESNSAEG